MIANGEASLLMFKQRVLYEYDYFRGFPFKGVYLGRALKRLSNQGSAGLLAHMVLLRALDHIATVYGRFGDVRYVSTSGSRCVLKHCFSTIMDGCIS